MVALLAFWREQGPQMEDLADPLVLSMGSRGLWMHPLASKPEPLAW